MNATYETQLCCRKLDENGDMVFGAGSEGMLYGLDAMKQILRSRLSVVAGEWWEGDRTAIPYLPDILGAPATRSVKDALDLMIINRIVDTVNVISVSNVKSSFENRVYRFSCDVQTIYGETEVEMSA